MTTLTLAHTFTDNNRFGDAATESKALIYQYTPEYTGEKGAFTQMYIFPVPQ